MKVLSVVGARPQFVKLAPVSAALDARGHEHVVVHTGQHYDPRLSADLLRDLGLRAPDVALGVGSGTHGVQTGAVLAAMDGVLDTYRPDWVLVYGDTNSTVAGALAAVKMHLPLAHLEAGLRSFNRRMPEEHNRVLTDHAADLCLAPTDLALRNLRREGLAHRSVVVGDVMTDVCLRTLAEVRERPPALPVEVTGSGPHLLATLHRAETTDDPRRLSEVVAALAGLPVPVVLLVHPRLRARAEAAAVDLGAGSLRPVAPLTHADMLGAVLRADGVVTDSGGLQKEAYLVGTPCTTVRTETEWPETLQGGWNVLVEEPSALAASATRGRPTAPRGAPYGDGDAATRTVVELERGPRT